MTTWRNGFAWGATLVCGAMLGFPGCVELDARDGWNQSHLAQILAIGADHAGPEMPVSMLTHVQPHDSPLAAKRYESHDFLPREFMLRTGNIEHKMHADGHLCPIVVLATPDEIRISPCLARVGAR